MSLVTITRNPAALGLEHPSLRAEAVDVLDAEAVHPVLAGIDAVISCVGIGASKTPTTLYSKGTPNLIDDMAVHGIWTSIRSPRIRPATPKRRYRLSADGPLRRGWMITAADVANALLDIAERDDLDRRHVYVAK